MRCTHLAALLFAMCSTQAAALPGCAGPVEAHDIVVSRVERDGVLVLADGRAVRLEGLLLPAGHLDHAPAFFAAQAVDTLSGLARGRSVTLLVMIPKEDRYGRVRAQVFFAGNPDKSWLQIAMLRRGLARVSIAPERRECATELYAAEGEARAARRGIWTSDAYAVRSPDALAGTLGTFQIVEGQVMSAAIKDGRGFLDFGSDWRHDFKVMIAPRDLRRFRDAGVDPRAYSGLTLRVRGYVDRLGGPEIEAASPEAIEVVRHP